MNRGAQFPFPSEAMMPAVESTQVGFRLRMQPSDLSTYPNAIKLMWFQWVVEIGLARKDRELAQGMDKDGVVGILRPDTIKHRKSEVGPTTPTAPFLTPSYVRSRVRSLLTGRAHTSSAEYYWRFDSHIGRSFAVILHYQAEAGHDVFGLSPAGIAWVTREATKKWEAWKAAGGYQRPVANVPGAKPVRKVEILEPIRKIEVKGRFDFKNMDLFGTAEEDLIRRATAAGTFSGFRRLNARGEKWRPGHGLGPRPRTPTPPRPTSGPGSVNVGKHGPAVQAALAKVAPGIAVQDLAALSGAGDRAKVTALPLLKGGVYVRVVHPDYEVRINIVKPGELAITALDVPEPRRGRGVGPAVMDRIVATAKRSGFKRITLRASREDGDIGYRVWPKSGFNAPIPADLLGSFPPSLSDARRISDLYATAEGQAWWAKHGRTIEMSRELAGPAAAKGKGPGPETQEPGDPQPHIDRAAKLVEQAGIQAVRDGSIEIQDVYGHEWTGVIAMFHPDDGKIYINELHEHWQDPAAYVRNRYRKKTPWYSTGSKDHVTRHEIGHAEHWRQLDPSEIDTLWDGQFNQQEKNLVKRLVGRFAAAGTNDFVAEVYAGLKAGKTYPAEILAIYDRLKGPKP